VWPCVDMEKVHTILFSLNTCLHFVKLPIIPKGDTVNGELYCKQLDRVDECLKGKQESVYFLHDNARPHVSKVTAQKLEELH